MIKNVLKYILYQINYAPLSKESIAFKSFAKSTEFIRTFSFVISTVDKSNEFIS